MVKNKRKLFYWASDIRNISGEGILGNKFLNDLKKKFKDYKLIPLNKKEYNYNSFFSKYIKPILAIFEIWICHLKGNRVAYINYLPLWNFLLFAALPSKTILGPITGTVNNKKFDTKVKLKYLLLEKIFYRITILFFFLKWKQLLFSTNMLYFNIPNKIKIKCQFNYILKDFKMKKLKNIKKNKIIFYYRNHSSKYNSNFFREINKISLNYELVAFGDNYKNPNVKNYGILNTKQLERLMSKCKYTFNGLENFYSLHLLNSIKNGLFVICDETLRKFNFHLQSNNILFYDYKDKNMNKKIINLLKKKIYSKKNQNLKIFVDLNKYFESFK